MIFLNKNYFLICQTKNNPQAIITTDTAIKDNTVSNSALNQKASKGLISEGTVSLG
jgi:hypothetical protein